MSDIYYTYGSCHHKCKVHFPVFLTDDNTSLVTHRLKTRADSTLASDCIMQTRPYKLCFSHYLSGGTVRSISILVFFFRGERLVAHQTSLCLQSQHDGESLYVD